MSNFGNFTVEAPHARLDRLVFAGTLRLLDDSYGMFCYMCRTTTHTHDAFTDTHAWFSDGADRYTEHLEQCAEDVKRYGNKQPKEVGSRVRTDPDRGEAVV